MKNCRGRKIYEIPICTVCLDPMQRDMAIFIGCGHVFHNNCANNAYMNSRKCPNCRIRSTELQTLHYRVDEVNGVEEYFLNVIQEMPQEQQQQMSKLMGDYDNVVAEFQKIKQQYDLISGKFKTLEAEAIQLRQDKSNLMEANILKDDKLRSVTQKYKQAEIVISTFEMDCKVHDIIIQEQSAKIKSLAYLHDLQNTLSKSSEDNYLRVLRMKPYETQCQELFDLFTLKNGEFNKLQREYEGMIETFDNNKKTINKLKDEIQEKDRTINQLRDLQRFQVPKERLYQNDSSSIDQNFDNKKKRIDIPTKPAAFGSNFMKKQPIQSSFLKKT